MNWNDLRLRLRAVFFRNRVESELDEEFALHLEMQARKNRESGMSGEEARREALAQFGRTSAVKEDCRDERRIRPIETLLQDIRYAIRGFRKAPAFALTVMATIGLGLGVNTAAFTVFNAYVLRPLAVYDPSSLYSVNWINRSGRRHVFSWPQFEQFRTENPAISDALTVRGFQVRVNGRQCFGEFVSGNYFQMLGVRAALGRTILPSDAAQRESVMALSYAAWQNQFGADPEILGRKLLVHGYPVEVVGVIRDGFTGLDDLPRDFWVPVTTYGQIMEGPAPFDASAPEMLRVIARLRPGVTHRSAQALLNALALKLTPGAQDTDKAVAIALESRATAVRISKPALIVLTPIVVAFALVLVIACANVANMMLARGLARQREIGIRLSLGAARSRLIRQLLTESILLALPAAAVGFVVSQLTVDAGSRVMLAAVPSEFIEFVRLPRLDPDPRVFAFMIAAATISGVVFGIAPAMQATRGGIVQAARGDFTHLLRPQRLRNALVLVQIAVCSLLLTCAGVLLRGANQVSKLSTGMQTRGVISIEMPERSRDKVLSAVAGHPLVSIIAASTTLPLDSGFPSAFVSTGNERAVLTSYDYVSPEFFDVLGIPIERGRNFTRDEAEASAPVALVSQSFAQSVWPGASAIGESVRLAPDSRSNLSRRTPAPSRTFRVIGVVGDVSTGFVDDQRSRMLVYFPSHARAAGTVLLVRIKGDTETARSSIDKKVGEAIDGIHKMQQLEAGRAFPFRMAYWVSAVLGGLALLLTIAGIYGVLSYLVVQRMREIGVRMALGATAASVVRLVLQQALRLTGIGIAVGCLLGVGAWKMLAAALPAVTSFDAAPFLGCALIVLTAAASAAFFPSLRASRVDPMTTLRQD